MKPRGTISTIRLSTALACGTGLILAFHATGAGAAPMSGQDACAALKALGPAWPDPSLRIDGATYRPAGPAPVSAPPGMMPPPPETLPAHCDATGSIRQRIGSDGQHYAIRFHLRLPDQWNGRFFFQGGGGSDGEIGDAIGRLGMGTPSALTQGYAVLSQDAGHDNATNTVPARNGAVAFGFDPQARADYGGASLGPAVEAGRAVVRRRYGKAPRYSYFVGCSKGGQEGLTLAQRYPALFDGIVANAPGLSLPRAAVAEAWDTQSFAGVVRASGAPLTPQSLAQSFSDADLAIVGRAILAACDADDGLADGMVNDFTHCTSAKVLPELAKATCAGAKQATCLAAAQVEALRRVHDGARTRAGAPVYASFFWDAGWGAPGWRIWKIGSADGKIPALNVALGAPSLAAVFTTPPTILPPGLQGGLDYQVGLDIDQAARAVDAVGGPFKTSAWQDVAARSTDLAPFARHGGRLIVTQGVSDPVFSIADTIAWAKEVDARAQGRSADYLRLFAIPGMNHCMGGPATDRVDTFAALVAWVEHKTAPDTLTAHAGPMSPWPGRTRPLCAYPKVARYRGTGSPDAATSFACS